VNQQQVSTTPINERDCWETPAWLYRWLDERFDFSSDLACSKGNRKAPFGFYSENVNSLEQDWFMTSGVGFCNPPYSSIKPWLAKGYEEAKKGFTSVFVVPTPNGEKAYQEHVFGKASEIIFINGRVAFCRPDGTEVKGNTRGSCVIVYDPQHLGNTAIRWADREELIKRYS